MVAGTAFSTGELRIPAGTQVTITADNTDGFHSFAVYESEDAAQSGEDPVAETEACGAPCKKTVDVTLTAGDHYFRCEVHPSVMNGTIIAE
jgi:plastocyanin